MRLYYDTVSTPLLSILRRLMSSEVFKDFKLVGGTALALQRGHRRSVDIDLFTDLDYAEMPVAAMRHYLEGLKPLSYWELKVLDLIEEVKTLTKSDNSH